MVGSILRILGFIPSVLKKLSFLRISKKRSSEYEKLNEELAAKDKDSTVSNLKRILK
jgi:uncharacterized membrane protein required for colicin V production